MVTIAMPRGINLKQLAKTLTLRAKIILQAVRGHTQKGEQGQPHLTNIPMLRDMGQQRPLRQHIAKDIIPMQLESTAT